MNNTNLSQKWLYLFIGIAIAAFGVCIAGIYYKEWVIAGGTALVFGAQVFNIIKWKRGK